MTRTTTSWPRQAQAGVLGREALLNPPPDNFYVCPECMHRWQPVMLSQDTLHPGVL